MNFRIDVMFFCDDSNFNFIFLLVSVFHLHGNLFVPQMLHVVAGSVGACFGTYSLSFVGRDSHYSASYFSVSNVK